MKVLVTGTAGFIGFHVANRLIKEGYDVVGLDSINDYYDVDLKLNRLKNAGIDVLPVVWNEILESSLHPNYRFIRMKMEDKTAMNELFEREKFDVVINLAAQAGVRFSLTNPHAYLESNMLGFLNILEASRYSEVKHLIYASSSSVYGLNTNVPFSVQESVDHPISLYAASKKSNELMAHTYSHLFGLPTTGLRFFTVYGPWGRPDMALFIFAKAMLADEEFEVYNYGDMSRDFTYIDDIVESIKRLIPKAPKPNPNYDHSKPNPAESSAPYQLFNIGNNSPVSLMEFIEAIEKSLGKKGRRKMMPLQAGDVTKTYAQVQSLFDYVDFKPNTKIEDGIEQFMKWYKNYYK
ncbi:MAG: UDP-glucuronate 4-epimerase [Bacteroidia bacterium]|jgi:UDP-glucuronate 4-epimerase